MKNNFVIETQALSKVYHPGTQAEVVALDAVDLKISAGEFVAIMGASGSGKSTLMNLVGCLDKPSSGRYLCDGVDVSTLDREELAKLRLSKLGFIFQGFNLLTRMDALHNVMMPLGYANTPMAERVSLAQKALDAVGLSGRSTHLPGAPSSITRRSYLPMNRPVHWIHAPAKKFWICSSDSRTKAIRWC